MNEAEKKDAERTCTEVLIKALEEFGKCEARAVVVLFTDAQGDLVMMRNASHSQTIGMCRYGEEMALRSIFGSRSS